jgi:HD-GYP domain-containing protein (c-di-GMP phosphodiesterase class II)
MHAGRRQVGSVPGRLYPVVVESLRPGVIDFDLYLQQEDLVKPVLYCRRSSHIQRADIDRLVGRGIAALYVSEADHAAYRNQVFEQLSAEDAIPPAQRYKMVRDISRAVFEATFKAGSVNEMLGLTNDLGSQLAETVCANDLVLSDLFHLMEHDNYTYTHSVNVCTYSLILAKRLGIGNASDLDSIAKGALLHDLGKRHIHASLLNKRGALSKAQRSRVQDHPTLGFKDLFLHEQVTWGQLMMVYQHHERVDGTGYPVALTGKEIHPWARICAVADVFHALTSTRPYRSPMSISQAVAHLHQEAGRALDKETVKCWTATMPVADCA